MADEKRRYLNEIFPWAAVDRALKQYSNFPTDWLANHIAEHLADYTDDPVLQKPAVVSTSSPPAELGIRPTSYINVAQDNLTQLRTLLKESFLKGMKTFRRRTSKKFRKLMKSAFQEVDYRVIDEVFQKTKSRRVATFCLLTLVSTNSRDTVGELGITLEQWTCRVSPNPEASDANVESFIKKSGKKYKSCRTLYDKLKQFNLILNVKDMILMPTVTCNVCFEEWFLTKTKFCGHDCATGHRFCFNCVIAHATAATESMPMAEDGAGLTCMEFNCQNSIHLTNLNTLLPHRILRCLEDRVFEENIGAAGIQIERCAKCNFAVEMEQPKKIDKVFHCPQCGHARCRLCNRPWNVAHFGLTCHEVDVREGNASYWRAVETQLNEAITRRCHKCKLQFVKTDGCNYITCRCRATQCYICRTTDITYSHFCDHPKEATQARCTICSGCMLFDDAVALDNTTINDIMKKATEAAPQTVNEKIMEVYIKETVEPKTFHAVV